MNRRDRRANRIKDPLGNPLEPQLLLVVARDAKGRPTDVRISYDDERLGDVVEGKRATGTGTAGVPAYEMLLVWMAPGQGSLS